MANGLINKELIMKAWTYLRKIEMTIPNETLDFMRDVALEKCAEMESCDWGMAETGERQSTIPDVVWRSEQLKAYAEFLCKTHAFQNYSNKDLAIDYCDSL